MACQHETFSNQRRGGDANRTLPQATLFFGCNIFFMQKKFAESVLRCLSCRFLSRTDHALALPLSQPFERTSDSSDEKNIISTAGVADVSRSLDAELEIASVCQPRDLEPSARRGVLQEVVSCRSVRSLNVLT